MALHNEAPRAAEEGLAVILARTNEMFNKGAMTGACVSELHARLDDASKSDHGWRHVLCVQCGK
jgi:hypothetical protein